MLHLCIPPPTQEQLKKAANAYMSNWNFPNCVGAIDGKHVRIKAPKTVGLLSLIIKNFIPSSYWPSWMRNINL